jgi:hypothetical protein
VGLKKQKEIGKNAAKTADLIYLSIKAKNSQQNLAEIDLANFSHFRHLTYRKCPE